MGQVFRYQALPDHARTYGAEQSQLEGAAERTVHQWGHGRCVRGVELTVITSGKSVIIAPSSSGTDCLLQVFRNVKRGLEARGRSLGCQGFRRNKASVIYSQGGPSRITWPHFLIIRPEHPAICIWLSCETLNMQSPAGANRKGVTEEVLRCATSFSKHLFLEPRNLNCTFRQKSLGIEPVWCNIVYLYLPLSSLGEDGNVKCPASAASCKTRCLQISSELLVLRCLGAWLWRNHWILKLRLNPQLFSPGLPFFFSGCHQSLPFARVLFCALETEHLS